MSPTDVEPPDTESVLCKIRDGIASIALNRPHRLNAFTPAMRSLYLETLDRLDGDPDVRAIVVTGTGRAFCAGADFKELEGLDAERMRARHAAQTQPLDRAMHLGKPLIAAVNGPVAGIGMAHLLMADLRFASPEARFTTAFSRIGLTAEGGLAWLLGRLVGTARALDLLYSARVVDAEEALRIGLVQWLVPADELLVRAHAYAADLAATTSAYSLAAMRRQVYDAWDQDWPDALARSRELVYESLDRPEYAELASRRSGTRRTPPRPRT
ncbi:enoyl-CoA hydratase-related protein [Actinomadura sp. KC345]|uniref:enoyl-CoA hydratase-related protein n=1 Tax=Actinomadura sp. KC345 TaxID=2530371 RepID=UPI00140436F9|nr:enoyl-CoA hydratase-related protein [Actinomadura sp. KC345]